MHTWIGTRSSRICGGGSKPGHAFLAQVLLVIFDFRSKERRCLGKGSAVSYSFLLDYCVGGGLVRHSKHLQFNVRFGKNMLGMQVFRSTNASFGAVKGHGPVHEKRDAVWNRNHRIDNVFMFLLMCFIHFYSANVFPADVQNLPQDTAVNSIQSSKLGEFVPHGQVLGIAIGQEMLATFREQRRETLDCSPLNGFNMSLK